MKSPPEIAYRGFEPMEAQIRAVEKELQDFEKYFSHVTSCSVIVTSPGSRHRNGDAFEITIRARLPTGKEIDVSKESGDDRYADFYFALSDSFKRAKRQLKEKATRLRGEVKTHVGRDLKNDWPA
jgi:ribosome-associated translation inhibitor RaiA